jgi:DNA-binding response OmpR family regulator
MLGKSILIMEDNADIREILRLILEAEGFNVNATEDCASGFEELLRRPPDLVITDVMLPDHSRLDFIRWVRKEPKLAELPIIAITAFENGYLTAAEHLGADRVLHKPEGLSHVIEVIKSVLAEKAERRPYHQPDGREAPRKVIISTDTSTETWPSTARS